MNPETSPIPEQEQTMEIGKKYENAIRIFLSEHKERWEKRKNGEKVKDVYESHEFDVSRPQFKDIENIASGNFEIRNIQITPRPKVKEKKNFHFYVGATEFHISGKAADRLMEIYEKESK